MMSAARWKALVALLLMVGAFAAGEAWRPTKHLSDMQAKVDLETMFPTTFGDWAVDTRQPVQLVSPDTQALLDKLYNQLLTRTYVNRQSGQRIMMSVAYGGDQSDGTRAHRPEVCYPAQGFEVIANHEATTLANGGRAACRAADLAVHATGSSALAGAHRLRAGQLGAQRARVGADRLAVPRSRRCGGGRGLLPVAGDDDPVPDGAAPAGRA